MTFSDEFGTAPDVVKYFGSDCNGGNINEPEVIFTPMCRGPVASIDLCSDLCDNKLGATQMCLLDIQINYFDTTCVSPSLALLKAKTFCLNLTPVNIPFTGRWVGLEFNMS